MKESEVDHLTLERAAERVRSAALEMRASADLRNVVAVVFDAMRALGINTPGASIQFVDEKAGIVSAYGAFTDPRAQGYHRIDDAAGERFVAVDEVVAIEDPRRFRIDDYKEKIEAWRDRHSFAANVQETTIAEYAGFFVDIVGMLPEEATAYLQHIEGHWTVTNVPFSYGSVGYRERDHHPEHADLVAELARGFDIGFLRFLDFRQLEQQRRELEVERELERVRTAAALMTQSGDLISVMQQVRSGLESLDISCNELALHVVDESRGTVSVTSGSSSSPVAYPVAASAQSLKEVPLANFSETWYPNWKKGEPWVRSFSPTDIVAMEERGEVREKGREDGDGGIDAVTLERSRREGVSIVDVPFEQGTLAANRIGENAFSADDVHLVERFTSVFALGYQRHLDLQAAEQRARDAELARAHEHVRTVVSSMEKADDIGRVVDVLREELRSVGVTCDQVGINIIDPETLAVQTDWNSELEVDESLPTPERRPGTDAREKLIQTWRDETVWNRARSETYIDAPGWVVDVPFQFGTLAMNRGQRDPDATQFTDDEVAALEAFADVVSLGYTRFSDFAMLEQQNRQLTIDRAVERVRAAALAMQSTEDLPKLAGVLRQQLVEFGFEGAPTVTYLDRETGRGIGLGCLPNPKTYGLPLADHLIEVDGDTVVTMAEIDPETAQRVRDVWELGRPKRQVLDVADPEFRGLREGVLRRIEVDLAEADRVGFLFPAATEWHGTWVPFSSGMVGFHAPEPQDPLLPLYEALTEALEFGFVRFLDIQKLEERNRELTIERAVERVRAEAAAMAKPEEIGKLMAALWEGADQVGCPRSGMNIVDEERQKFYVLASLGDDDLHVLDLDSDVQLVAGNFLPGMHLVRSNVLPLRLAHEQGWAAPGMEPRIVPMADDFPQAMQRLWGHYNPVWEDIIGVPVVNVPFSYGGLFGFENSTPNSERLGDWEPGQPTEQDLRLLERFADAVSFGYGRYLELVAAEERARQLILDRAVERVRAEAAAMRESTDLGKVLLALGEGWREVGLSLTAWGVNIVDGKAGTFHSNYLHSDEVNELLPPVTAKGLERLIVHRDVAPGLHLARSLEQPVEWGRECGLVLPEDDMGVGSVAALPGDHFRDLQVLLGLDEPPQLLVGDSFLRLPFAHGALYAYAEPGVVYTEAEAQTAARFADAVGLGYTRYLDLVAAEERARQAAIETAAERLRAAAMAMQSQEEVRNVGGTLLTEMLALGIDTPVANIYYHDPGSDEWRLFFTNHNLRRYGLEWNSPDVVEFDDEIITIGSSVSAGDRDFLDQVQKTRGVETRTRSTTVERSVELLRSIGIASPDLETNPILEQWVGEWQVVYIPFDFGALAYMERQHVPANIAVVEELATALNLGFVRFFDFQRLEEQNRHQAIETAAERVRVAAMEMQSQEDLRNVAGVLYTEINGLGIRTPRVSIDFFDPGSGRARGYGTLLNPARYGRKWTIPDLVEYNEEVAIVVYDLNPDRFAEGVKGSSDNN